MKLRKIMEKIVFDYNSHKRDTISIRKVVDMWLAIILVYVSYKYSMHEKKENERQRIRQDQADKGITPWY